MLILEQCQPDAEKLTAADAKKLGREIAGWTIFDDRIEKTFSFTSNQETMNFANAVAWIANRQNHHPEMSISMNTCTLTWFTQELAGLSRNDFICAAKVEALFLV